MSEWMDSERVRWSWDHGHLRYFITGQGTTALHGNMAITEERVRGWAQLLKTTIPMPAGRGTESKEG